jgi:hypothetical protein
MRLRHLSLFIGNASFFTCWIKLCYYAGAKALPLPASPPNSDSLRPLPLSVHPPRLTRAARGAWGQTQRKRKVAPFRKRGMWYGFDALAWYRKERGVKRCLPPPAPPRAPPGLRAVSPNAAPNAVRNRFRLRRASRERRCELRAVVAEPRAASPAAGSRARPDRGAEERGFGRTSSTPGGCGRGRSRRGSERAARPPTRWSRLSALWPTSSACPAPAWAAAPRGPAPRASHPCACSRPARADAVGALAGGRRFFVCKMEEAFWAWRRVAECARFARDFRRARLSERAWAGWREHFVDTQAQYIEVTEKLRATLVPSHHPPVRPALCPNAHARPPAGRRARAAAGASDDEAVRGRVPPPPLVLSGHAASFTPY